MIHRPLIGLTLHPSNAPDRAELDLLLGWIAGLVERAGGLPVYVPLGLGDQTLRGLYERLDGVLFSGGGDVDPALYGGRAGGAIDGVDAERDRAEMALARWAVADDKPFFGICRGAQVINVAHGGTLYRDTDEHPGAQRHAYYPDLPFDLRPHPVQVVSDSLLARVLGGLTPGSPLRIEVNSLHHQACKDIAPALRPAAFAPDGIVEAVEARGCRFGLAVQWHPECLPEDAAMRGLFEAFVSAARA
jgi:putative glutamine amidotransferase